MALLEKEGYGQVELNNVAFRRDGRIEAQCALDATDFAKIPCENGMILAVDKVNKVVKFPEADSSLPVALVYSAEHIYDERDISLSQQKVELADDFYPRLGYFAVGDLYTTNYVDVNGLTPTKGQFASAGVAGAPVLSATIPASGLALLVTDVRTMPDGQTAVQFQCVRA